MIENTFTANYSNYNDFGGYEQIIFASDEKADQYLIIQNTHEYTEQDISLGMNALHFEFCSQIYGQYGGVNEIKMEQNTLIFILNEKCTIAQKTNFSFLKILLTKNSKCKFLLENLEKFFEKNHIKNNFTNAT